MSSFSFKKKSIKLSPFEESDWLSRKYLKEKFCRHCGTRLIKNDDQYCSKECDMRDSIWRFGE
jgi:hypothetical protein